MDYQSFMSYVLAQQFTTFILFMYTYQISCQLKLESIRELPHYLSHKIFYTACMMEMTDKKLIYNTELYQAVVSLNRVLITKKIYTIKQKHELDSYIKYSLNIPEGCADDVNLEYLSILNNILDGDDTVCNLVKIAELYSNTNAIIRLSEIIEKYDIYYSFWQINFIDEFSSKTSIVKTIIKMLTLIVDHPESIACYSDEHENYNKMFNILDYDTWEDEDHELRYGKCGSFINYIHDSITRDDMQKDYFSEFGRYNHRRKHKKYHIDDLMNTVNRISMEELTEFLEYIKNY